MAVDTRDKRFSMIGLTSPTLVYQQNPTGTVGAPARELLLFLYSGIALAAPGGFTAKFRKTFSGIGTRVGGRQPMGWQ